MADARQVEVRTTRTTTVTLSEEQAASYLRTAIRGAPDNAKVTFDCGYEYLREVTITWKEEY
jgi:hypothetical protein